MPLQTIIITKINFLTLLFFTLALFFLSSVYSYGSWFLLILCSDSSLVDLLGSNFYVYIYKEGGPVSVSSVYKWSHTEGTHLCGLVHGVSNLYTSLAEICEEGTSAQVHHFVAINDFVNKTHILCYSYSPYICGGVSAH